jgi:hypothetical protein
MKRHCLPVVLLLLGLGMNCLGLSGLKDACCWAMGVSSAGNGFYKVFVVDSLNVFSGEYSVTTGAQHPAAIDGNCTFFSADGNCSLLNGGEFPGTSFNTIRSYTTHTEYIQDTNGSQFHTPSPGYTLVSLGPYSVVQPDGRTVEDIIDPVSGAVTGLRTTYVLPGANPPPGQNPTNDALTIIQVVKANGTTLYRSWVEITTTVINSGADPVRIGIRYRWDLQIGDDGGPTLQPINPDGTVWTTEKQFIKPRFEMFRIVDNDMNPFPPPDSNPPTYYVFGTNTGPDWIRPLPTFPDVLQYVCFFPSPVPAFVDPVNECVDIANYDNCCCGAPHGGDSVAEYFFGYLPSDNSTIITLPAGSEQMVSESLLLTDKHNPLPPNPPHPPITVDALNSPAMVSFFMLLVGIYVVLVGMKRKQERRSLKS